MATIKAMDRQIENKLAQIKQLNQATSAIIDRVDKRTRSRRQWPTGATSHAGRIGDPFIDMGQQSTKVFTMPTGKLAPATMKTMLHHDVRDPARAVNMVPALAQNCLLSMGKFADTDYIAIFDKEEVKIYNATNTAITVLRGAILRGWHDQDTGLWRIPLKPSVDNLNTDTCIVSKPPTELLPARLPPVEAINSVYELCTQKEIVRYYHAACGFPTQATWPKAINAGNYASWPGLSVRVVKRYFLESEVTQKGHMRKTKAGVRSTKPKIVEQAEPSNPGNQKSTKIFSIES